MGRWGGRCIGGLGKWGVRAGHGAMLHVQHVRRDKGKCGVMEIQSWGIARSAVA